MRNIKLTIEYDGANYAGWQIQNKPQPSTLRRQHKTIQGVIEKTLKRILRERIRLVVAGRTDAGVHAEAQVANFKTSSSITLDKLKRALNGLLPKDISIIKAEEVGLEFNSCFDAKSKVYRYTILNRSYPSALLRDKVYFYPLMLDIKLMRKVSRNLLGRHDFAAFCASGSSVKHTVRTIKNITIKELLRNSSTLNYGRKDSSLIFIDIEADGFLYNMVRNIVGTLLEVGRGRVSPLKLKKIILSKNRRLSGPTVPAKGLSLIKVNY